MPAENVDGLLQGGTGYNVPAIIYTYSKQELVYDCVEWDKADDWTER